MTIPHPLATWALRHHVSDEALDELRLMMRPLPPPPPGDTSEARAQSEVRLEAGRLGVHLWRNNVGALRDENSRVVRFGLANDSPQLNAIFKSSDLIGLRPVVVTPEMVGRTLGQFVAREIKRPGWTYTGTPREQAQAAFIHHVQALGGDAGFATGVGSL